MLPRRSLPCVLAAVMISTALPCETRGDGRAEQLLLDSAPPKEEIRPSLGPTTAGDGEVAWFIADASTPAEKPAPSTDRPQTMYRVVVDLDSGAALHRAGAVGLAGARAGAHDYEIERQVLERLQAEGVKTWIVGGTTRASLHPSLLPPPALHLARPAVAESSADAAGADSGGTSPLSSGALDLPIEDETGNALAYRLRLSQAPADSRVTSVRYRTRLSDEGDGAFYCGDYEIWLFSGDPAFEHSVYDNLGGRTDGRYDDDADDDLDIYLDWRSTSAFDGEDPNQWWGVVAWDSLSGDDGKLDYIELQIDWVVEEGDVYEPDGSPGEAYTMPHNHTSAFRSIEPVGDEDWFRFSLSSSAQVVLETSGPSGDTRLWLYDSGLAQIDFDDDGGDGLFSRIARGLSAGTYYSQIDVYDDDESIADYALSLSVDASAPDLVASGFRNAGSVSEAEPFTVEVDVRNDGGATAAASHARLYLSIDGDFDVSDDYAVTAGGAVGAISSGATGTARWDFSFPRLLDATEYVVWLLAAVDSRGEVSESSENNLFISSGTIVVTGSNSGNLEAPADEGNHPSASAAASVGGSGSASLFAEPHGRWLDSPGRAFSAGAIQARRVRVNRNAISADTQLLNVLLLDGSRVQVNRTAFTIHGQDRVTWRGRVVAGGGRVVLSRVGDAVAGLFYTRDGVYELGTTAEGQVFAQLDQDQFPECAGGVPVSGPAALAGLATAGDDPASQIDVLAVYTAEARAAAGGTAAIEATIQSAVDVANTAFEDSQMVARLRLVHAALVAYSDSGSSSADLDWVRTDPGVAALRDQYAADMVGLIVDDGGGFCGRGYVMRTPGPGFASHAFQVTARSCAVGNLSYAHEHGHNLGFEHDPANGPSSTSASYPYAFGHFVSGSYRTVMSYANQCTSSCTRVAHFSNPGVSHAGTPTGIADQRDNHRVGNQTAGIAANFRQSVTPCSSLAVPAHAVTGTELYEACSTLSAGTGVWVEPGGRLILYSAARVVLGDGFEVLQGGELEMGIDPTLVDPVPDSRLLVEGLVPSEPE